MLSINTNNINKNIPKALQELNKMGFDFCVCGGIICQFYLGKHARYTEDIDIVTNLEVKDFEKMFKEHFHVISFSYQPVSPVFFEETFSARVEIDDEEIIIEGMKINFYKDIVSKEYEINGVPFKGTNVEFVVAEKFIALNNELDRLYKHFVELYSFSLLDESVIDKKEVKRYVNLINEDENVVRALFNKPEVKVIYKLREDKKFFGPTVLPTLQAKHNVSKETMETSVNDWLAKF